MTGVHTATLGHGTTGAQRANGAAGPRIEQIAHADDRYDHADPDQVVELAATVEDVITECERWHSGDAGLAAEAGDIGEQVIQADTPGNRPNR